MLTLTDKSASKTATTGRFISLEGTEGVGKTTANQKLCEKLDLAGIDYINTREPGGTPFYEKIRSILIDPLTDINDDTELLLLFAGRCDHVEKVIMPALEKGTWVICDRFIDSSIAYQGFGRRHGDAAMLHKINTMIELFVPKLPDLTLWLDMPVVEGMSRANKRGAADRFEQQEIEFFTRIYNGFKTLAEQHQDRIERIDALGTSDDVNARIWQAIQNKFNIHKN